MNILLVKNRKAYADLPSQSIWENHIVAYWNESGGVEIVKDRFSVTHNFSMSAEEFSAYLEKLQYQQVQ
jgi:hypothetical protein